MTEMTSTTQAILLLTSEFSTKVHNTVNPLSPNEWGRFASWLHTNKLKPENLFNQNLEEILSEWSDSEITLERIKTLMNRGTALALAMEKWQRVGIWVINRSDENYPKNLKKRLKQLSPAILFGVGNKKLLNTKSIAVVGSRNAQKDETDYAYNVGAKVAKDNYTLISGGAKGIDEKSMYGATSNGGNGIVVLAEDLLKRSMSKQYRDLILNDQIVLISSFYPESVFSVANSMARNKYIYASAEFSIVVASNTSGGTWSGAKEAISNNWSPVFVKASTKNESGNQKLISLGANLLEEDFLEQNFSALTVSKTESIDKKAQKNLFDLEESGSSQDKEDKVKISNIANLSLYEFFILKLKDLSTRNNLVKAKDLEKSLDLKTAQLNEWLSKAEEEGFVIRLEGRIRKYEIVKRC